jgi:hypothetical protein
MELRGSRMRCVLAALGALTFAGCNFGGDLQQRTDGVSAVIGPGGGILALPGGAALEIPAGALAKDTTISIARSSAQAPGGALSSVYDFGPEGTTFSKPVTVTFTVPDGSAAGSVYWTTSQNADEELATLIQGATAVAQIGRLGHGFVGAPCGHGSAPACAVRRDVTAAFETVFWTDDGRKTRVKKPQPGVTVSALVPKTGGGYQRLPAVFEPDGSSFTIHAVPAGRYFLQIEGMPRQQGPILYEFTTSSPDLSSVVSYRQDLARASRATPVTLNVSNLDAWTPGTTLTGDLFEIASSQANLSLRPWNRSALPAAGSTAFIGTVDWQSVLNVVADNAIPGLPDAAKGDVVWFYQARHQTIGSGAAAAVYRPATKVARVSSLTLQDGAPSTVEVPLVPVPQTRSMVADVRYTRFAALAADINPSAKVQQFTFNVFATPHLTDSLDKPDDSMAVRPLLLGHDFTTGSASLPDTNYGTVAYGQFTDQPLWQEFRQTLYLYDVTISPPVGTPFTWTAFVTAQEPMSSAPIAPGLGPVRAPRINGRDLFTPQTGVGLEPTISWSAPALGEPTSVFVGIVAVDTGSVLQATVRTGSSFKVPVGVLAAGKTYVVTLTAQEAPWDGADAPPFRFGLPFYTADCFTSTFTP